MGVEAINSRNHLRQSHKLLAAYSEYYVVQSRDVLLLHTGSRYTVRSAICVVSKYRYQSTFYCCMIWKRTAAAVQQQQCSSTERACPKSPSVFRCNADTASFPLPEQPGLLPTCSTNSFASIIYDLFYGSTGPTGTTT